MSRYRKAPRLRVAGECRWCGHTAVSWPLLRWQGRSGPRVLCCFACWGPHPLNAERPAPFGGRAAR